MGSDNPWVQIIHGFR